jgi:NADH-quinone oxidoreductase subunit N
MNALMLFAPEATCLLVALVLFFCAAFRVRHATTWLVGVAGFAAVCVAAAASLHSRGDLFSGGVYRVDAFSQLVKLVLAAGLLLAHLACREPRTMRPTAWGELPMLLAVSTAGMMMLASATELVTLYVALELSAYPLYILAALGRGRRLGTEAAVKYMLQGMASSAVSLYGISFLFGASGSTFLSVIAADAGSLATMPVFWLGLSLALAGFLFKLAAFPFHFWAPDTYQAAPHQVVMFIATVSKVAAVALLARLVGLVIAPGIDASALQMMLVVASIAAMTVGNLAAIVQRDLKRLLGYSAVAHAGYVLIGLQSLSSLGLTSALFYVFGYLAMGLLCFVVVIEVGRDGELVALESLAGLHQRSPLLALALLTGIFGLTGLPPTAGFLGKWFLFSSALENGQFALVLVAGLNSAVAVYYYMRVLRQAYLMPPATGERLAPGALTSAVAVALIAVVLWLGIAPNAVWVAAGEAAAAVVSGP